MTQAASPSAGMSGVRHDGPRTPQRGRGSVRDPGHTNAGHATTGAPDPATADATAAAPTLWRRRERVRTPGKHIVLFLVAAILMLSLSTSVLERRGRADAAFAFSQQGDLFSAPFEPIIADRATDDAGRDRCVSRTPVVVLKGEAARDEFSIHEAAVRERMAMLLRALTAADFEDEAGMRRVKEELRARVNLILDTDGAQEVIIHDLIIQ